jgi:glucose/arabinose dehydrogenase
MTTRNRWAHGLVFAAALFAGVSLAPSCGGDGGGAREAEGPGYGKEDSGDAADLECRIVLRSLAMSEDGAKVVGLLDAEAAEVDGGATPNVLFTFEIGANDGAKFLQLDAKSLKEVAGGLEGYQRFSFEIDVQGKEALELIPFLGTKTGRFFDHNRDVDGIEGVRPDRRPGANNDNYFAERGKAFAIPLDESKCPKAKCRLPGVQINRAYAGVTLRDPTSIKWEPNRNASSRRVFVTEKLGRILAFPDRENVTNADVTVFLDWSNKPGQTRDADKTYNRGGRFGTDAPGWEEGFLDLALHPEWPTVPQAFVTYNTGLGDPESKDGSGEAFWNLARFESTDGGKTLDPKTRKVLLRERKQALTHNAGAIVFHPQDQTMFVSIGTDGGFPFDLFGNAQNPAKLFGSIIRINVVDESKIDPAVGYSIPEDNPFAGGTTPDGKAARPEIWTYGNRNPWRMSFDRETLDMWGAEVGENTREEVNIYEKGGNYGYPLFEGTVCTFRGAEAVGCSGTGLQFPVFELYASDSQRPAGGIAGDSVTGGYVYRGTEMPDLVGWYLFGDFITGELLAFDPASSAKDPKVVQETGKNIASFGENPEGEIYFLNHQMREQRVEDNPSARADGEIYKVQPAACQVKPPEPTVDYAFLSADGAGSERAALAYYRSILPEGRTVDTYTLDQWKEDYVGDRPTVAALYRNTWDLSFWRDMTCTTELERGKGGCWVTNWQEEQQSPQAVNFDANSKVPDLGTVCMNVSEEGFTRFYVFVPDPQTGDRKLNPFAILDDERKDGVTEDDKKFVPHLCTPCHSGTKYRLNGSPDLNAIFREFDPALMTLEIGQTFSKDQLEARFFDLNAAVKTANQALNTRSPMVEFLTSLYPNGSPPARDTFGTDGFADQFLPESWADDPSGDAAVIAAKRDLWYDFVNPFCMGCHRVRKIEVDFNEYDRFKGLGVKVGDRIPLFDFVTGDPTDREGHPIFMPQTQWLFDRLNGTGGDFMPSDPHGKTAAQAVAAWLDALEALQPATCDVTFVTNGPDFTQPGQDVFITGQVGDVDTGELGRWTPWDGLQLDGTDFPQWRATTALPQGAKLQFKATVVDSRQATKDECGGQPKVQWANGFNSEAVVDTKAACTQTIEIDAADFQAAVCE